MSILLEHPLLAPLLLEGHEPMLFWRDRWHWPWWDAATFDRLVSSAHARFEDRGDQKAQSTRIVVAAQQHPLMWAAEELAARLGCVCEVDRGPAAETGRRARPSDSAHDGLSEVWRVEQVDEEAIELRPDPVTQSRVSASARRLEGAEHESSSGESAVTVQVGGSWIPAAHIRSLAERLSEECGDGAGERPVVLLSGSLPSWASRVAMAWGAAHRACWLFGDPGVDGIEDLIWARPHAMFAGEAELQALLTRFQRRKDRRRLRRGLERLELAVFERAGRSVEQPPSGRPRTGDEPTSHADHPAAERPGSNSLDALRDLLGSRRRTRTSTLTVGELSDGDWRMLASQRFSSRAPLDGAG